jgi:hypothetical protein
MGVTRTLHIETIDCKTVFRVTVVGSRQFNFLDHGNQSRLWIHSTSACPTNFTSPFSHPGRAQDTHPEASPVCQQLFLVTRWDVGGVGATAPTSIARTLRAGMWRRQVQYSSLLSLFSGCGAQLWTCRLLLPTCRGMHCKNALPYLVALTMVRYCRWPRRGARSVLSPSFSPPSLTLATKRLICCITNTFSRRFRPRKSVLLSMYAWPAAFQISAVETWTFTPVLLKVCRPAHTVAHRKHICKQPSCYVWSTYHCRSDARNTLRASISTIYLQRETEEKARQPETKLGAIAQTRHTARLRDAKRSRIRNPKPTHGARDRPKQPQPRAGRARALEPGRRHSSRRTRPTDTGTRCPGKGQR